MDQRRGTEVVARLRAAATEVAANDARLVVLVHDLDVEVRDQLAAEPPSLLTGLRWDDCDTDALVVGEIVAALGLGERAAETQLALARRLHGPLSQTRTALETGRLDLARARALHDATRDLPAHAARLVQDAVLPGAGSAPWEGPSLVLWRRRIARAVKRFRAQADHTDRAHEQASLAARTRTWVQVDPDQPALSTFAIVALTEDILWLDRTLTDHAHHRPAAGPDGQPISIGQRRVAALLDAVKGTSTVAPASPTDTPAESAGSRRSRERELGLVMHVDTLLGEGPAANDPAEIRGVGAPVPITADAARQLAHRQHTGTSFGLDTAHDGHRDGSRDNAGVGARTASTCVLLTDDTGCLQRLVRIGTPPPGGWTRDTLSAIVRARIATEDTAAGGSVDHARRLATDSYAPTTAIADHVRAHYPTCTRPGCHRTSRDCDLDHDDHWPRGPTSAANLNPKSRRCHRWKTLNLWRSDMQTRRIHPLDHLHRHLRHLPTRATPRPRTRRGLRRGPLELTGGLTESTWFVEYPGCRRRGDGRVRYRPCAVPASRTTGAGPPPTTR